jgi:hypothetical protein
MRRLITFCVLSLFMTGIVPVWTARWVEEERRKALARVSEASALPSACPADDSFFVFLDRNHTPTQRSAALWRPLCHKAQPPIGKVAVLTDRAESFRHCVAQLNFHRASAAHCWLDPQVSFLADAQASRTFARVALADTQGREVLWATTTPLAWDSHLQSQHRAWMAAVCLLAMLICSLRLSRRRWIVAGWLQRQLGSSNTVPPAGVERLLLYFLPPFNYPQEADDLRESYADTLATHGEAEANRWYRWQVRQSLVYYLRQRLTRLQHHSVKRTSTGGG